MSDTPAFGAWDIATLARFAQDAYLRMQALEEANEQLRLDLKDAMRLVRMGYPAEKEVKA